MTYALPAQAPPQGNRAARRRAKRVQMLAGRHDLERQYRSRTPRPDAPRRTRYVDVIPESNVRDKDFADTLDHVDRSGLVPMFESALDSDVGRRRTITVLALFVVMQLVGFRRNHAAHVVAYTRCLNSFTSEQLRRVGMSSWDWDGSEGRLGTLYNNVYDAMFEGFRATDADGTEVWVDEQYVADAITEASREPDLPTSHSLVGDGSKVATWGATQVRNVAYDDANLPEMPDDLRPEVKKPSKAAKIRGRRGKRKLYTPDWDATGGHHSANGRDDAGQHCGYEQFAFTQVRDIDSRGRLGPRVPAIIRGFTVAPAGSHRNLASIPQLLMWKESGRIAFDDVVLDRGHTSLRYGTLHVPLADAGVTLHEDLHQRNRGKRVNEHSVSLVIKVDDHYYDARMPDWLIDLPAHDKDDTAKERLNKALHFEMREPYRWEPHGKPDKRGRQRLISPWERKKLRSRAKNYRHTMRLKPKGRPIVRGITDDCPYPPKTITVRMSESPRRQPFPYGTPRWLRAYGRRAVVEGSFSGMKHSFVQVGDRGWRRTFGLTKTTLALAFAVAGFNRLQQRQFRATEAKAAQAALRAEGLRPRRAGDWLADLVDDEHREAYETLLSQHGIRSGDPPSTGPPPG